MNFTEQQNTIVERFRTGEGLAVKSVAGSGKTATLVGAFQFAGPSSLCVAFNKRNVADLEARMPEHVRSRTLNSIGHAAWGQHIGKNLALDNKKLWALWGAYKHKQQLGSDAPEIVKLVKLAKAFGIRSGILGLGRPNLEEWEDLGQRQDIDNPGMLLPHAAWLLAESCRSAFEGLIDFDDQIYMPAMYNSPLKRYDTVAVDEAQDLSSLQHLLVARSLAPKGQILVVGDPNQGIYAFRGAKSNSFESLATQFKLPTLPLSVSFRCPKAVVTEAQKYVPEMRAAPENEQGTCIKQSAMVPRLNLTVLCRYNAPIVNLAFRALRDAIPVNYLGRDFMSGLIKLHKDNPTVRALEVWYDERISKIRSQGAADRMRDRYLSLIHLHEVARPGGLSVTESLRRMGEPPKAAAFTLSTIHKAKGLEWDNVAYLDYYKETDGEQEKNVRYVGVTRAKKNLVLGDPA